jgi:hypothetical protein
MKIKLLTTVVVFATVAAIAVTPQVKSTVNKDARFFVQHFEQTDHTTYHGRMDFEWGDFWQDEHAQDSALTWDDGKGGQQTSTINGSTDDSYYGPSTYDFSTLNAWPATWWPNLVKGTYTDSGGGFGGGRPHPPQIVFEHRDEDQKQDYSYADFSGRYEPIYNGSYIETGHYTHTLRTKMVLKFYAGGMGLPKRKSVYAGSVAAVGHKQTGTEGNYNDPVYDSNPIPSQNITLGDLGQLDPDGIVYAVIDEGSTKDVTPKVDSKKWYTFGWPVLTKYTFMSRVSCVALTDTNLERTSLGVGETVSLGSLPPETRWRTSAGTLTAAVGSVNGLTAASQAGAATVTATIRNVSLSMDFSVAEPSGVQATLRGLPDAFSYNPQSVGAGMEMNVVVQPTHVSFSAIQMQEPAEATTGITGYFLQHTPPSHGGNGAGDWHPVGCNNLILGPPIDVFDHAFSSGWPAGQSGAYTWPIHAIWRVGTNGVTHPLSGWTDQVHTLDSDGTMTVEKLGHHVTRHPYEQYGTAN